MSVDYMADWRQAQTEGHHPDCDGWMTTHRVELVVNEHRLMRAVCEECGPLHVGSFGPAAHDACRRFLSHAVEETCDKRCLSWE